MFTRVVACVALGTAFAFSSVARAQDVPPPPDDIRCCAPAGGDLAAPANEWQWWLGGGVMFPQDASAGGMLRIGVAGLHAFAGERGWSQYGPPPETAEGGGLERAFMAGPYVIGETDFRSALIDGGLEFALRGSGIWDNFAIRAGAGYGTASNWHGGLLSASVLWGAVWLERESRYEMGCSAHPDLSAPSAQRVSSLRLFVTGRAPMRSDVPYSISIGLEFDPIDLLERALDDDGESTRYWGESN